MIEILAGLVGAFVGMLILEAVVLGIARFFGLYAIDVQNLPIRG